MGGLFGNVMVYFLSITGKYYALYKGIAGGTMICGFWYGMLGRLGLTTVRPASPKTIISELVAHALGGATCVTIATKIGDPALFSGELPLNASSGQDGAKNIPGVMDYKTRKLKGKIIYKAFT